MNNKKSARKRNNQKARAQKIHASQRLWERYKIELTKSIMIDIRHDLNNGNCEILAKESNRIIIYAIEICGKYIPMVYDKIRKNPVTFLEWKHLNNISLTYEETYDNSLMFTFE